MIEICNKAIKRFGKKKQMVKVTEEIGELLTAISRYTLQPSHINHENVLEEIADSHIMLCQLAIMYDSPSMHQYIIVLRRKISKLERLMSSR